jgi:hypothetical protein
MSIKKQGKLFFLFAVLFGCLTGMAADDASLLVKTWKLADLRYSVPAVRNLPPDVVKAINDMKKGFTLTYRADGTYTSAMNGAALSGKWKYIADSSRLSVITEGGMKKEYTVTQLTRDTFSFITREGKEDTEFVMVPAKASANIPLWIVIGGAIVLAVSAFVVYRERGNKT